jgi:hypothetical protein
MRNEARHPSHPRVGRALRRATAASNAKDVSAYQNAQAADERAYAKLATLDPADATTRV